ncbi:hypothetical protein IX321_001921 [Bacteroides pyogenes]|uniref:glycosyltransferase family 4 protein n=1 Tax=Bacteroides pyogenes TaxID=310300 RepID=UPI001BA835E3|nr:glycosyltransferase family 4 protein [Bacteroides pyogenes]MBR8709113.1 hypothetical protein [Bacteroides pyogenes]MBR8717972.1 hypothetical protein [Bacteroides pyogenes]MBR8747413.1 hypothetical protein [Bacteroides pyogenes]MBR8757758.1 hypothetical protein [Bacteroides pyogenes]MBR8780982.1 hypothetical protein [Bacteroides pyogenes]
MRLPKVIIIHPDRQHSLQTALALQNKGYLYRYITTVYLKKNSLSLLFASIAPSSIKKKFFKHKLEDLDDSKIILFCQAKMLFLSLFAKFFSSDKITKYRKEIIDEFNEKCLSYCLKQDFDVLITFDTLSGDTYSQLKEKGVKLVLDMSAPCFLEMYENFKQDVDKHPADSALLKAYLESPKVKENFVKCKKEIRLYDYFLSASSFTSDSLVKHGVNPEVIILAPYGLTQIDCPEKNTHSSFSCTFVGSVTQQKGCHYIFRIAEKYPEVIFNLVGSYDHSYDGHIPSNCILHGYLSFTEIKSILKDTNLFLFLSLADGFGFAATEAMAYGIPVVCSKNAGVRDFVAGSGWIIAPDDTEKLSEILKWSIGHPEELNKRGELARLKVTNVQWSKYGQILSDFITKIL